MTIRVFGLTGGVASGKSAVASCLRARGVPVVDADEVARAVVRPGTPGLAEVVAEFGEVLSEDGSLDRKRLGALVFADDRARKRLEGLLHPRIAVETARRLQELNDAGVELACYDAALLVERGLHESFRPLVVVAAPREVQCARLMQRDGLDAAEAERRIDAQLPLEDKLRVADFIIDNRGTLEALEREVARVVTSLRLVGPPS